jgi:hypothetical protein
MKIQINDSNYSYYKKIFEIISNEVFTRFPSGILKDAHPVDVLNTWELKSKTLAKRGLKAGLQDLISEIKEFPAEMKSTIDSELLKNNLPGLHELQGTVDKIISQVLKRKKINSLEEFYIVKEQVIDLSSDLSEEDRKILDKCLYDFEFIRLSKKDS